MKRMAGEILLSYEEKIIKTMNTKLKNVVGRYNRESVLEY